MAFSFELYLMKIKVTFKIIPEKVEGQVTVTGQNRFLRSLLTIVASKATK